MARRVEMPRDYIRSDHWPEPDGFVPRLDSCDDDDPPGVRAEDLEPEPLPEKCWA